MSDETRSRRFPDGFVWGVSTAAYQIEGAAAIGGRGPSIWDTFSHASGKVLHGDTGDVATDHYHRLEEDLDLLAELGVDVYRLSFAWPRIIPAGTGKANVPGLEFYDRLVDGLRARRIEPVVTLYHWDLPQALQDRGGWASREVVDAFADYARLVGEHFGDRVSMWTTINEPWVATYLGHALGLHAPGLVDRQLAARVHHNLLLAHAAARDALRGTVSDAQVGIALNMSEIHPALDTNASRAAASLAFDQLVSSFLGPLRGAGYPERIPDFSDWWEAGAGIVEAGDLELISGPIDFLSINEYHPRYVVDPGDLDAARVSGFSGASKTPFAIGLPFVDLDPPDSEKTPMGWIIEPEGLSDLLVHISRLWPDMPLYISENGAAFYDYPDPSGDIRDTERIAYFAAHFEAAAQAIARGVDLRGYFLWSFLDNYEWAAGYSARFGLVYVDYPTGARTPKESFGWFRSLIADGGEVQRTRAANCV